MIGIDIVRQSLQDNSNKNNNPALLKKLALLKIEEELSSNFQSYRMRDTLRRIMTSKLPDSKKKELFKYFSNETEKICEKSKKELDEIFGFKKSSTENKEENASVEADDEESSVETKKKKRHHSEDEEKTPADHVEDNNETTGNVVFKN